MSQQMIDKDTVVCISISERPSNFGTTVHNAAYRACSLNYIYKAFAVTDVAGAITAVRALGIRGCSVSMPFKETIIQFLDMLDETASTIGAVNTVVNSNGVLTGFNTDAYGAEMALRSILAKPNDQVLLLGAGGVAKAFAFALKGMGFSNIHVANRTFSKIDRLTQILPSTAVPWEEREAVHADLLINATSIGMAPESEFMPIGEEYLGRTRAVIDVVLSPFESRLIKMAKTKGLRVAEGFRMSLHQAARQFMLYTGVEPPIDVMQNAMMDLLDAQSQ